MLREKDPCTETELSLLLSQARDLYQQLEDVLAAAIRAAGEGNRDKASICAGKANILISRMGKLGTPETTRTGRPRAAIPESGDRTLGQIRNAMRLCVPAGTLARELGISESTFRRRLRKTDCLPDEVLFSQIP